MGGSQSSGITRRSLWRHISALAILFHQVLCYDVRATDFRCSLGSRVIAGCIGAGEIGCDHKYRPFPTQVWHVRLWGTHNGLRTDCHARHCDCDIWPLSKSAARVTYQDLMTAQNPPSNSGSAALQYTSNTYTFLFNMMIPLTLGSDNPYSFVIPPGGIPHADRANPAFSYICRISTLNLPLKSHFLPRACCAD